jgi:hypothetical protein
VSDFLGRLARRAVAVPALRPRVASRFESAGSPLALNEAAVSPPMSPAAPAAPAVPTAPMPGDDRAAGHRPTAAAPAPRRDAAPGTWPFGEVATPPHRQPVVPPPVNSSRRSSADATEPPGAIGLRARQPEPPGQAGPAAAPRAAEAPPPARRRTPSTPLPAEVQASLAERDAPAHSEPQSRRSQIESRGVERLIELPLHGRGAAGPPPPGRAPPPAATPAAPRVEIHIGRIELMPAVPPAAEPRRPSAPQPRPPQSLEAYLQQRSKP